MSSHRAPNWTEGMCQSEVCQEIFHALQFDVLLFWTVNTCPVISPRRLVRLHPTVFSACNTFLQCPVTALFSWPVLNLLPSDVKLFITCLSHVPRFPEKGILSENNVYTWYYSLNVLPTLPFLLKSNENDKRFISGASTYAYLIGHVLSAFISKRSSLTYGSKQFAAS